MDSRTNIEDRPWSNSSVWRTSTSRAVPNPHFNKRIKLLKIREKQNNGSRLLNYWGEWATAAVIAAFVELVHLFCRSSACHTAPNRSFRGFLCKRTIAVSPDQKTHTKKNIIFFFMTEQIETPWSDRVSNWPPPCRCPILERKPAKPENKGRSSVLDYDSNSITIGKKVCSYARL